MSKKTAKDFLEKTILASFVAEQWTWDEHRHRLKSTHFETYFFLFELLEQFASSDKIFDIDILETKVAQNNIQKFYEVVATPAVANVRYYIDELKEIHRKASLLEVAQSIARDDGKSSEQILFALEELLESKNEILEVKHKTFDEWAEFYKDAPLLPRYATGVSFLDFLLAGGVEMGQLMLLSGQAESGKTSLGIQILKNVSEGAKVAFFAFEFTVRHFVEAQLFVNGKYKNPNMYVINDGMDLESLASNIKAFAKEGVRFFLIDSQMRVEVERARNSEEEESRKFSTLAKLAHKYELFIVFIIQTSKTDPNSPIGSKKGSHESSITIHIEHVPVPKEDAQNSKNPWVPDRRVIEVKKNKQTGKHFKEIVGFNPQNREFHMVHDKNTIPVTVVYHDTNINKKMEVPRL